MRNKLAHSIYDRSPVWAQDLLLSAYGLQLKRTRYGGSYQQQLDQLMQERTHDELRELQAQELARLLVHAQRHVPWYRRLFADHGIQASQIDLENFSRLVPILEKSQLHAHAQQLVADNLASRQLHTINTSGTTGSPLNVVTTVTALQKNYAFFERFLRSAGVSSNDPSVTFAGRMLLPARQSGPPYWRRNLAANTLLCSSYHIAPATAADYLRRIADFKPTYIDAYPSAAFTLAQHLLAQPEHHDINLRAIVTSSETLFEHQRALIEQAFGCRVFDQYGNAEMAACITQCEHGLYHVNMEYGIVEVLREDGTAAAAGESGELVCTGFLNHAMPMIRYRIGDSAIVADTACDCGRPWPTLSALLGRADDQILATDGRQIGRLDPLFKGLDGIKETQLVQTAPNQIIVNLVRTADYTASTGDKLVEALKARVGYDMHVELHFLEHIPRTAAGKFRAVISKLDAGQTAPSEQ